MADLPPMQSSTDLAERLSDRAQRYAILGVIGTHLHCMDILLLARTFGDLVSPEGDGMFAIGYDTRPSSASLAEIVSIGLRSGGHHVTHLGACTTPCLEWSIVELAFSGGIMITGGQSPPDWNGLRFYRREARPMPVMPIVKAASSWSLSDLLGTECNQTLRHRHMLTDYAIFLRRSVRSIQLMKIALDAGNGLIGTQAETIFSHLYGIRVWPVGFEPHLEFSTRGLNPFNRSGLSQLAKVVTKNGCNLGAAFDPGGERLAIIDENGHSVSPEALGWLFARKQLELHPQRAILHDIHCHERPTDITQTQSVSGGAFEAWEALHDLQTASLYFDNKGHYAFADTPGTANALYALMMLINRLDELNIPLSKAVSQTE